jgi:hypothetical protein
MNFRNKLFFFGSTALVGLNGLFGSIIYTQSVGLLGRGVSPSQGRYLHTGQHKHRTPGHTELVTKRCRTTDGTRRTGAKEPRWSGIPDANSTSASQWKCRVYQRQSKAKQRPEVDSADAITQGPVGFRDLSVSLTHLLYELHAPG